MSTNIRTAVEQLAGPIGKDIGTSDDHTQAAFLNNFCEMLDVSCGRGLDTQLCWVADKLTERSKRVILRLAAFCETTVT